MSDGSTNKKAKTKILATTQWRTTRKSLRNSHNPLTNVVVSTNIYRHKASGGVNQADIGCLSDAL